MLVSCALSDGVGADVVSLPAARDNTLFESPTGALSNGSGDATWLHTDYNTALWATPGVIT